MKKYLVSGSPWILAAACGLLAVIIGSFALNNYHREKRLMELALLQKGQSVLRFVDTAVKVSFRGHLMGLNDSKYSWIEHVQEIIPQAMDGGDVHYLELVDQRGVVRAASREQRIGRRVDSDTASFLKLGQGVKPGDRPVYRMIRGNGGDRQGFQVVRGYGPGMQGDMGPPAIRGRGMMDRVFRGKRSEEFRDELERLRQESFVLLAELDVTDYNRAVKRQVFQIIILSVVLLLVGVGGWLSLLTLQGLKGSQSRLSEIRAFNDILIESLPVGLVATDGDGCIQTMNDVAGKILQVEPGAAVMSLPAETLPPEIAGCMGPGKKITLPYSAEQVVTDSQGNTRTVLITVIAISNEEEIIGEVMLMQDVSEVRGLEVQLRRSERLAALGKMAAGVAHELRNPLSSVKGLAVLLKSKLGGDAEGLQTADVLVGEVERLNRSISELLEYARPEKLDKGVVPLHAILEKTLMLVRVDAEQQGIVLTSSFAAEPDRVLVDEDRMNQVFLNVLLNAVQAESEGGRISVETRLENSHVICTVMDSGEGIAEENLNRVFDPYFTTKNDGTGLGLAISAKIVEEHGGSISIDSTLGQGTTVTVELPLIAS